MNKKNLKSILAVLIILIILIFLVCIEINTNKEYGNIGIDNSELNIFFFNVGQAESILITNNNAKMLIDCGNNSDGKYISKFLKEQGIGELDYLIGTHIDEDHIGGMQEILTNIKVETLYMPYSTYEGKQFYIQLEEYIKENNINKQQIEKSEDKEYKLGNAIWKCLNVDNSNSSDKNRFNDTSIVIKLDYGSTKYLFTGDITDSIDSKIKGLEKVDVLKVAHHGAKESTSSEFLNIVKPTYAIISAGNNENYNHPDQSVIERLKEAGVEESNIFITKNQGTIWLKSDGNSIIIEKLKELNLDGANKVELTDINGNNPIPAGIAKQYLYGISGISLELEDSENSIIYQLYFNDIGWSKIYKDGENASIANNKIIEGLRIAVVPKSEVEFVINEWSK